MKNTVTVESNHLIYIELAGEQTASIINEVNHQVQQQIKEKNLTTVSLLMDISKVSTTDSGSRKAGSQMLNTLPYRKAAIFGATGLIKQIAALVIKGSGKSATVKQFKTTTEARQWLAEDA